MSDYASTVYGSITYNLIDKNTQGVIEGFIRDGSLLDKHVSKKCERPAAYSLPPAYVSSVGIEFNPQTAQFLDIKESIGVVVSFIRALGVKDIKVDIIRVGSDGSLDNIEHFKIDEDCRVLSSVATVSFNHYE